MILHFCTLFDSGYFSRGMALYASLQKQCPSFHLYILAMDSEVEHQLKALQLRFVTIIPLTTFEDKALLEVKPTRSRGEYCWTCTPSIIAYVLQTYSCDHCTYLDADLYFFDNPQLLIDEMGKRSVLITPHRYTPRYDQSRVSGIYCVQFMTFNNTPEGWTVLNWWKEACLDWCYSRPEEGKFGDQKYLDDWTERFSGVHVLQHLGGGVAPWNMQQYRFFKENDRVFGIEKKSGQLFPVVFFHFHNLKERRWLWPDYGHYELPRSAKKYLYQPYLQALTLTRTKDSYKI